MNCRLVADPKSFNRGKPRESLESVAVTNRYLDHLRSNFSELAQERFCTLVGTDGDVVLSWRDLESNCAAWGRAYLEVGAVQGDQVLIFLRHTPDLYGAFFGAMFAGLTPAFMPCTTPRQDPKLYWASHDELLRKIRPAVLVADRCTLDEMADAKLDLAAARILRPEELNRKATGLPDIDPPESGIGLLQHSSGTTGLKKGVALSYRAIVEQVENYAGVIRIGRDDTIVSWLPLYHDMGLIACCIMPAFLGVPVVHIDPFHWLTKPGLLFERMQAARTTFTWLPNFAFDHLAAICARRAGEFDLSNVRAFINCSEPCKPATFDRFLKAFEAGGVRSEQLQCCYAMAESVFAVTQTEVGKPVHRVRVSTDSLIRGSAPVRPSGPEGVELVECGQSIPGIDVSILDESGAELGPGTVGEIALSGCFMFDGYNQDPVRTAERIVDGVYRTNDLGFVDEEGRLYVLGRLDDLIIVNGRNLYAHQVEVVVSQVPGVKAGRAVAMSEFSDRIGSEVLLVAAEQRNGDTRERAEIQRDIQAGVQSTFGVVPYRILVVDEGSLVKTTSGKISRKENLARFAMHGG